LKGVRPPSNSPKSTGVQRTVHGKGVLKAFHGMRRDGE
jgi:hypothetical protein